MTTKTKTVSKKTAGGVVRHEGKDRFGGEKWVIDGGRGKGSRTVVTSPSSAAAIDRIATKQSKALKRLADK